MSVQSDYPVVVGVDGSPAALDAVTYAAAEAVRRQRPLLILSALAFPFMGAPVDQRYMGQIERELRDKAAHVLAESAGRARETAPDLEIRTQVVVASAAGTLIAESHDAPIVVVGAHGRGALSDVVAGSVAVQVATHAHGPVLVVRGAEHPRGDVILGADGSPHSEAATGYAFAEAARRHTGVTAVRAWRRPMIGGSAYLMPATEAERESAEIQILGESLSPWRAKFPDVPVDLRAVCAGAASALVDASQRAVLVVVGARGYGGFTGLLLGSVGQALMHRAHCPVAIVRPDRP